MERRTFIGAVAAACATAAGAGRVGAQVDAQVDGEDEAPTGWTVPPYDEKRRRTNPDGAGLPQALAGVEQAWTFDAETAVTPVVSGGTVYFGSSDGVTAVDAGTGEEVWSHETEGAVRETPAFYDGTVYAGTDDGRFVALDSGNGDEKWSVGLDGGVTTSPMVSGVDIYVGTEKFLYSLDVANGNENWSFETRVASEAAPAVTEERVVFIDGALVFGLDRFTGEREWRSYAGGTLSDVVIGETRVYTTGKSTVYAQRLRNGVDRWTATVRGNIVGGPVLHGSTLHVATDSGFLYSLDLNSDGWTNWEKEFTGAFVGSPVLVDGTLYGVTRDGNEGHLYAVDPSNGETVGKYVLGNERIEQDDDDQIEGADFDLTGGPTVAGANAYVAGVEGVHAFGDNEEVPPTASFDISPPSPSTGDTVTFDASSSSSGTAPIESYEWRFSSDVDEFSAGGETYEEVFEEDSNWTVSVTVTDEEGMSDTATKEMRVGGSTGASDGNSTDDRRVEGVNETESVADTPSPGFLEDVGDGVFLALGALGAVVSALGFSAYWRMEPEREKLRRQKEGGGLCPDCGASVREEQAECRVCGSQIRNQK